MQQDKNSLEQAYIDLLAHSTEAVKTQNRETETWRDKYVASLEEKFQLLEKYTLAMDKLNLAYEKLLAMSSQREKDWKDKTNKREVRDTKRMTELNNAYQKGDAFLFIALMWESIMWFDQSQLQAILVNCCTKDNRPTYDNVITESLIDKAIQARINVFKMMQ